MATQPTNAGIITDAAGVRQIPESTRADGSTRRAIKIRPGYQPPEDVALYKSRIAENYRNRIKNGTVPGAEVKDDTKTAAPAAPAPVVGGSAGVPGAAPVTETSAESASAANKNAKRREARKKAAAAAAETTTTPAAKTTTTTNGSATKTEATPHVPVEDPQAEREKKARGLKKKLKQAKELQSKRDVGEALLPEQIAKVIRISELVRELDALGFDAEGESKT